MRLISQTEAAAIKGVAKQTLAGLSQRVWGFFVDSGGSKMVDIDHPHWRLYLRGEKPPKNIVLPAKAPKIKAGKKGQAKVPLNSKLPDKTIKVAGDNDEKGAGEKPAIDIASQLMAYAEVSLSLRDLKTYTEVQKMYIEMDVRLGGLVERKLVEARFGQLSQEIQMFVDIGRRVSGFICQKLERTGLEKIVEKIINEEIEKIIQDFKMLCKKSLHS